MPALRIKLQELTSEIDNKHNDKILSNNSCKFLQFRNIKLGQVLSHLHLDLLLLLASISISSILLLTNMQIVNLHHNPAHLKIKRNKPRNESLDYSVSKQNYQQQNSKAKIIYPALKEISINISSAKQTPLKQISSKSLHSEHSFINKCYSISNYTTEKTSLKYIHQIEKQNQFLRIKITQTNEKIAQFEKKNILMKEKYRKLKQNECNKMRAQIKRLNLDKYDKNSQSQSDWNSVLEVSNQQQKHCESRMKLSQIKQRINDLDLSRINKFAKDTKKECIGHERK